MHFEQQQERSDRVSSDPTQAPLCERVSSLIASRQEGISRLVYEHAEAHQYTGLNTDRPLSSNLICGISSRFIQLSCLLAGFDCHTYKRRLPVKSPHHLEEVLPYGACVHKIAVVSEKDLKVVVDGGYLQFLRSITDTLPKEDILVFPVEELSSLAKDFAALNSQSSFKGMIQIMPDQGPGNRKVDGPTVDIPVATHSLESYLKALWNLRSGDFVLDDESPNVQRAVHDFLRGDRSRIKPILLNEIRATLVGNGEIPNKV